MKKWKILILIILLVLEVLMTAEMLGITLEDHAAGVISGGPAFLVAFCGFSVVTLAELLRMKKGKEKIILPMIGMYVVMFTMGLSVGMYADYHVSGDGTALGEGIAFTCLTLILTGAGFGMRQRSGKKKSSGGSDPVAAVKKYMFDRYDAEWYWEDAFEEFSQQHDLEDDEIRNEHSDEIFVYACNYIAYLFLWLLKRGGLKQDLLKVFDAEEIDGLKKEEKNPAEFVYYKMDGKLGRDDVAEHYRDFLDDYYERIGFADRERELSYGKDYEEIVSECSEQGKTILYCSDFSWEKYGVFEKRLDERFEDYLRNRPYDLLEKTDRTVYSEGLRQELEIHKQALVPGFFPDIKQQAYDHYAEDCLKHVANFPKEMVEEICDKLIREWGPDWVDESLHETFLSQIGCGEIDIYYPYGDEIAYVLCFEADFESEHGISIGIKGDKVLYVNYRLDGDSPWAD